MSGNDKRLPKISIYSSTRQGRKRGVSSLRMPEQARAACRVRVGRAAQDKDACTSLEPHHYPEPVK